MPEREGRDARSWRPPADAGALLFSSLLFSSLIIFSLGFSACTGNGGSVDSGGDVYNPNGTPVSSGSGGSGGSGASSGSSGSSGSSSGSFTAQDLMDAANAGNAGKIIQLVSQDSGSAGPETQTVTLSAADLGLPANGTVTLTITGAVQYNRTVSADADGFVRFEVPMVETNSVVTIELTVQDANGFILYSGSNTQQVNGTSNLEVKLLRQFWTLPSSLTVAVSPSVIAYNDTAPDSTSVTFSITNLSGAPDGVAFTYSWKDETGAEVGTGATLTRTAGDMLGPGFSPMNDSETRTYSVEVSYTDASGSRVTSSGSATATIATAATLTLTGSGILPEGDRYALAMKKGDSVSFTADVLCYGGTVTYSRTPPSDPAFGPVSGSGANNETASISPTAGGQYTLTVTATLADGRELTKDIDVYVLDLTVSEGGSLLGPADPVFITDATGDTRSTSLTAALNGLAGLSGVSYSWQVGNTAYATVSPASGTAAATTTITGAATGTTTVLVTASYKGVTTTPVSHPLYVAGIAFTTFPKSFAMGGATSSCSLAAEVQGYSGTVTWNPWTSETTSVATVTGQTDSVSSSSVTLNALAGGRTKVSVSATVGGVTLSAEKEIYILQLTLACTDGSFTSPSGISDPNYKLTMIKGNPLTTDITANLAGLPEGSVSCTWTPLTSTKLDMETRGSGNKTVRLTPLAAGNETVSVQATYDGESITMSVDVSVVGITLTGSSTLVFNSDPTANQIALTATLENIGLTDLTDSGIQFTSGATSIATVTAGAATSTGRTATVTALKGGTVTITVTAAIRATGRVFSAKKDITIIRLLVKDGADHDVPATGNSLNDGPVTLTAQLEGLTEGTGFSWACTPASGSDISISATSGPTTTVSGSSGTASVTLTATYGGSSYDKTMEFVVPYTVAYTDSAALGTFLDDITGTDAAHPAKVNITGLTAGNWTDIRDALLWCESVPVYVDLSATTLPDGITNMHDGFTNCRYLVAPPAIPAGVSDMGNCFEGCTSLSGTVTINASITNSNNWTDAFKDVDASKITKIKVPDAATQTALRNSYGMPTALKAKVLCPSDPGYND